MGSAFRGAVTKFNPDIFFDPEHPEKSHATVEIDVSGITTGDKERDASLFIKDWFDLAEFPTARFASDSFKRTGKNTYEAPGTLTIKSVSVPVVLPFTIEMTAPGQGLKKAHVKGSVVLDRSKFHLGQGEWADPGVIANNVTVDIDLTAYTK
jgi:polyisoprenoid-binding protein YceI